MVVVVVMIGKIMFMIINDGDDCYEAEWGEVEAEEFIGGFTLVFTMVAMLVVVVLVFMMIYEKLFVKHQTMRLLIKILLTLTE